jgi:hypothetical protein
MRSAPTPTGDFHNKIGHLQTFRRSPKQGGVAQLGVSGADKRRSGDLRV